MHPNAGSLKIAAAGTFGLATIKLFSAVFGMGLSCADKIATIG